MTMRGARPHGDVLAVFFAALAVAFVAGCPSARAQPQQAQRSQLASGAPPKALQGFSQNRDQPVTIKALSLDVHDRSKVATFTGNVNVVQGDTTMRCKTLVVYYDGDTSGGPTVQSNASSGPGTQQIRRMEAKGDVLVIQKDQTATGDRAIYDTQQNTVTLFAPRGGSVAITQGPNVMKGESLVVHLDTGLSHLQSAGGQVEGLIIPNSTKGPRGDAKTAPGSQTGGQAGSQAGSQAPPKAPSGAPKGLY
jgi:lipopolysaccharide export system protein LptA